MSPMGSIGAGPWTVFALPYLHTAWIPTLWASQAGLSKPSVSFVDRFDRSNTATNLGTAQSGQAWTQRRGVWGIRDSATGKAYNSTPLNAALATAEGPVPDGVYSGLFNFVANAGNPSGVMLRGNSDGSGLVFLVDETNGARIYKADAAGVLTALTPVTAWKPTTNTNYWFYLVFDGPALSFRVDWTEHATHTLAGADAVTYGSGTGVGLWSNGAAGTTQVWDDAHIWPLGTSAIISLEQGALDAVGDMDATAAAGKYGLLCWNRQAWVLRCFKATVLRAAFSAALSTQRGYIAFAIPYIRQPANTMTIVSFSDEATNNNVVRVRLNSSRLEIVQQTGAATNTMRGGTVISAPVVPFVGEVWSDGALTTIRYNGVAETITPVSGTNTGQWIGDAVGVDNGVIGANKDQTESGFFDGDLAGLVICTDLPPASERDFVDPYMDYELMGLRPSVPLPTGEQILFDAATMAASLLPGQTADIASLTDLSGNTRNAVPSGGPLVVMEDEDGEWCLRWNDGFAGLLQSLSFASALTQPYTLYIAARLRSMGAAAQRMWEGSAATGLRMEAQTSGKVVIYAGGAPEGVHRHWMDKAIWRVELSGAATDFYKNGLNSGVQNAGLNGQPQVTIGSNGTGAGAHAELDIYRVVQFPNIRTLAQSLTTEQAIVAAYPSFSLYANPLGIRGIGVVKDADACAVGILPGYAKPAVLTVSTQEGVYLFKQVTLTQWTRSVVKEGGMGELQAVNMGDVDGDGKVEFFAAEQSTGIVRCFKPDTGDAYGTYSSGAIASGLDGMQAIGVRDIDGDTRPELYVGYEGTSILGVTTGAFIVMKWVAGNVLLPGSWTTKVVHEIPGAWGFGTSTGDDSRAWQNLASTGRPYVIGFSRRSRNQVTGAGAIVRLEQPANPMVDAWGVTTVRQDDTEDWSRGDQGNFYDDGHTQDIAAMYRDLAVTPNVRRLCLFRRDTGFPMEVIWEPAGDLYNVFVDIRPSGRDRIWAVVEYEGLYLGTWSGSAWVFALQHPLTGVPHPWDTKAVRLDLGLDAVTRIVIGGGEENSVRYFTPPA